MKNKTGIAVSAPVLKEVLKNLPQGAILVGGQSLIFWVAYYKITEASQGVAAVSMDADILGNRSHVAMIANATGGVARYPLKKAMTIISGQVLLLVGNNNFVNIDIIHRIGTMDTDGIKRRAVEMDVDGYPFLVMHPIDVLISRAENYRTIKDKQNAAGLRQVALSVKVAEQYVIDAAKRSEKIALKAIEKIAETARSPAGKFARKHGVEIYDALNPAKLAKIIKSDQFITRKLPRLSAEMARQKNHL